MPKKKEHFMSNALKTVDKTAEGYVVTTYLDKRNKNISTIERLDLNYKLHGLQEKYSPGNVLSETEERKHGFKHGLEVRYDSQGKPLANTIKVYYEGVCLEEDTLKNVAKLQSFETAKTLEKQNEIYSILSMYIEKMKDTGKSATFLEFLLNNHTSLGEKDLKNFMDSTSEQITLYQTALERHEQMFKDAKEILELKLKQNGRKTKEKTVDEFSI